MALVIGEPPLIQAIMRSDAEAVRATILKNTDVNYQDAEKRTPLHCAAFIGSVEITEQLILSGAKVKAKDSKWLTPLHVACYARNEDVVEMLLRHEADANARDKNWQTPLHVAASRNAIRCVEFLLTFVSNINVADRAGRTALHHAACHGHEEMCELLISRQANVNTPDKKERRAVHWACVAGHLDIVHTLTLQCADCSTPDRNGDTPLHAAAAGGHKPVLEELIDSLSVEFDTPQLRDMRGLNLSAPNKVTDADSERFRAALNAQNDAGNTALHVATLNGHDLCVATLLERGADPTVRNTGGQTALHIAACSPGGALCLKALLDADETAATHIHVDSAQADGNTPLHLATAYGLHNRASVLIQHGANVEVRNRAGQTPLHLATKFGHSDCVRVLLRSNADTLARTASPQGATPLHIAATHGHTDCVRLLLEAMTHCAALELTDEQGNTVLHSACVAGRAELLQMLLASGANVRTLNAARRSPLHVLAICAGGNAAAPNRRQLRSFNENTTEHSDDDEDDRSHRDRDRTTPPMPVLLKRSDADRIVNCITALINAAEAAHDDPKRPAGASGLVNETDNLGCTVLHYAAAFSAPCELGPSDIHSPLLETLIRKVQHSAIESSAKLSKRARNGARRHEPIDASVRDSNGLLALHYAAMSGHAINLSNVISLMEPAEVTAAFNPLAPTDGVHVGAAPTWSALHLAAASGSVDVLHTVLRHVRDRDALDCVTDQRSGRTPLHVAAACGNADCCLALLARGASHSRRDAVFRQSPVHLAAAFGHAEVLRVLLRKDQKEPGADRSLANTADQHGRSALMLAAQNGHADCIDVLLDARADPRSADVYGRTALHRAAACGYLPIARRLVDAVDSKSSKHSTSVIDARDFRGVTAVHLAAAGGHVDTLRFLLERAHRRCALDRRGYSPLHFAMFQDNVDCLELLLEELDESEYLLIPVSSPNATGDSRSGSVSESDSLKRTDPDVSQIRFRGSTYSPLHCAAQNGATQCTLTLLQRLTSHSSGSVDRLVNASDRRGRTPLHLAALCDRAEVLRTILAFGADPNQRDSAGRTPALLAALGNAVATLTLLLDSDAIRRATQAALAAEPSSNATDTGLFAVDSEGNSLLHAACGSESPNAATLVFTKLDAALSALTDADSRRAIVERFVNAPNSEGKSALHVAAASGNILATHTLVERGASVFAFDGRGNLPVASCAPNERVAHTIGILVQAMFTATASFRQQSNSNSDIDTSGLNEAFNETLNRRISEALDAQRADADVESELRRTKPANTTLTAVIDTSMSSRCRERSNGALSQSNTSSTDSSKQLQHLSAVGEGESE